MNHSISKEPLVSVLINNYNYDQFLADSIDSVLGQTYSNIEIIAVDDGSTDGSREVLKQYEDKITSVFKTNGGQASAMNAGFAASKGAIICLLDADDLFLPEKVAQVVSLFQLHPNIDWVFTESVPVETSKIDRERFEPLFDSIRQSNPLNTVESIDFTAQILKGKSPSFTPSTSNLCFSRKLLEVIFPLPEVKGLSGMAITDLYIKTLAVGFSRGCVTKQNLGIYRFHDNYYKNVDLSKKRRLFGEIYTTTGYWIQKNFPDFRVIGEKLLAKGFATYQSSQYFPETPENANCDRMFTTYLNSLSPVGKTRFWLIYSYFKSRLLFKQFV
ncbi:MULTISPECIES: glycosyltransferase [Cyanophyceae]|uniref:glycosyltransferase family 2 protein n=1 Tax=Cyanophyceae TaxID=3028117 RepID=UPI001688542E|nr:MULTISPECIES: glycosyltransferase [Cyanophyceae]MBD1918202.1 glycosyltransferase [Phormidium sp. FACHB-77]MBD2030234.1 glycosyltransferase [Phormidium sp. FACHB-322]MBD2051394.1 glycosyltransferase [Leptolyngbya sp. FACHB-60]